jgi:hypothetical protein
LSVARLLLTDGIGPVCSERSVHLLDELGSLLDTHTDELLVILAWLALPRAGKLSAQETPA